MSQNLALLAEESGLGFIFSGKQYTVLTVIC